MDTSPDKFYARQFSLRELLLWMVVVVLCLPPGWFLWTLWESEPQWSVEVFVPWQTTKDAAERPTETVLVPAENGTKVTDVLGVSNHPAEVSSLVRLGTTDRVVFVPAHDAIAIRPGER